MAFLPEYTFTFLLSTEKPGGGGPSYNDERAERRQDERAIKWKLKKRERWEGEGGVKDHHWRQKQKQREKRGNVVNYNCNLLLSV